MYCPEWSCIQYPFFCKCKYSVLAALRSYMLFTGSCSHAEAIQCGRNMYSYLLDLRGEMLVSRRYIFIVSFAECYVGCLLLD